MIDTSKRFGRIAAIIAIVGLTVLAAAGCGQQQAAGHASAAASTDGASVSAARTGTISSADAAPMGDAVPAGATIDRSTNQIIFSGKDVQFDVVGSPQGQRDLTFRIAGLVNPTIVLPQGAAVRVRFVNADPTMPHDFVLVSALTTFPPVPASRAAFAGAVTSVLTAPSQGRMNEQVISFTAAATGNYTYLCTVPGHAAGGMHGSLVVQ